ncbi:MAG: peptide ABC transporter substrate-binding protein [Patescibacteria group bacterium]
MFKILTYTFKTFSRNERLTFFAAFLIFIISFIFIGANLFDERTFFAPVFGGRYTEGVIGQPSFINPVFIGNNDADRDLTELIFSDLSDLVESYKISSDGRVWNVRLKENIVWQDGEPITGDDVIFTIKTIQDPDSRSALFSSWQGVTTERISEREIKLTLSELYAFFEISLKELKPIPKHIFESLPIANLRLSDYNLEPIGNGPFKFISFKKEKSGFISEYRLVGNERYFNQKPYLEEIVFKFHQNEDELVKAFNSGTIDGFGGLNPKDFSKIGVNYQILKLRMPRYYAVFLNSYSKPVLKDKNVRLALNYAIDKKSIVEKVFNGQAIWPAGPLILGMKGYAADIYPEENFSLEKANIILDNLGWRLNNDGIREIPRKSKFDAEQKKIGKESDSPVGEAERLEFNLIVPQTPFLIETANLIKENWSNIGVKLNLIIRPVAEINDGAIKNRDYEMIIFGNIFGNSDSPDLYSFWHSSERFYPGFNLALYENKIADTLIESIRNNLNEQKRNRDLASLQSLIIQDSPAIFLFSPYYFYITKTSLKGFEDIEQSRKIISFSSNRFENIEKWYVKTARVFK